MMEGLAGYFNKYFVHLKKINNDNDEKYYFNLVFFVIPMNRDNLERVRKGGRLAIIIL
jgi:hypothetical protein